MHGLTAFAVAQGIDLVIVGPEVSLAAGLVDSLSSAGIAAFGPTRAAAQLEWDKAFTRQIAEELKLPSPAFASFASAAQTDEAITWADPQTLIVANEERRIFRLKVSALTPVKE